MRAISSSFNPATKNSPPSSPANRFGGHFARPLKGLYFQPGREPGVLSVIQEVQAIGKEEGIVVAAHTDDYLDIHLKDIPLGERRRYPNPVILDSNRSLWAQDCNFIKDGEVLGASSQGMNFIGQWRCSQGSPYELKALGQAKKLAKVLNRPYRQLKSYLEWGDVFLGQRTNGQSLLLIGEDSVDMNAKRLLKTELSKVRASVAYALDCFAGMLGSKTVEETRQKWIAEYRKQALADIAEDLNLTPKEIVVLPQPDFHLDMAIRPLQYPYVLVHDPAITEQWVTDFSESEAGFASFQSTPEPVYNLLNQEDYDDRHPERYHPVLYPMTLVKELWSSVFSASILQERGRYASTDQMCEALRKAGLTPIRVGGVFPEDTMRDPKLDDPSPWLPANFLNATVHQRANGDLVYITNDSGVPEMNAWFEADLRQKAPWVKRVEFVGKAPQPNTVSWLSTFLKLCGGIHCLSVEDPA